MAAKYRAAMVITQGLAKRKNIMRETTSLSDISLIPLFTVAFEPQ